MTRIIYTLLIFSLFLPVCAQKGGEKTYNFITLTNAARVAALGGNNITLYDNDINLVYHNPATLKKDMKNGIVLNYVPYMADINYGYFAYAGHIENIGSFCIGIHNINYGSFDRTNENAEINGVFSAAEYSLNLSYARELAPTLSMGITIKPIYSKFDTYTSLALATDFGVIYHKDEKLFSMGLVLRNFGSQLSSYDGISEKLPTDLQFGLTKKLAHAPFRFSLTAQDLLNWDQSYQVNDPENPTSANSEEEDQELSFGDNLMRHLIFGIEFLPTKNIHIDFGYNHRRRKELGYSERLSTVGYSWGFGFRLYKFHFSYGSARYHLGGSSNHFSISTNLSEFRKRN